MPLTSGLRLGPYEIVAPIGAGGMGEVYRARDTRLDRTVAVKVLPAELAANPEQRQRLEREARAVSALNHPNICTLYDIGHQDGIDYLVMEFLEGETLSARLARGPLPLDQVLRYAREIAEALAAAHRQGVFHRDLKPGNIMLVRTGTKLLDFGLAKVGVGRQGLGVGDATISRELTQKGSILGTLQYMAPEQLQGEPTDARTDLFAFGAVVYEMVTGRKAFEGSNQASVIAAILEREPPAIGSSGALDRIVGRCLVKDPEERWQTARDLASELQWMAGGGGVAASPPATARSRERVAWGLAAILLVVAAGLAVLRLRSAPPAANDTPVFRFPVVPPEKTTFPGTPLALSPDGARLAFWAVTEGRLRLWVRSLDSLAAQPIADTDNPLNHMFWSPDGRYVAFCAQGKLKKVEVATGRVEILCDASSLVGGSWNGEDVILFVPNGLSPVYRVAASGGAASQVTALDRSRATVGHFWPQFLPDGRRFLYSVLTGKEEYSGTYVGSLDRPAESQDARPLVKAIAALYAPPGYLLFPRDSDLHAWHFDLARLQVTGEPRLLAARAGGATLNRIPRPMFSASRNGALAYRVGGEDHTEFIWYDRAGKQAGSITGGLAVSRPVLSPDGRRVAWDGPTSGSASMDLWVDDLSRGSRLRLTFDPATDAFPVWSPDGGRLAFASTRDGAFSLYVKASSGAGNEELLWKTANGTIPTDWSADGKLLLFQQSDPVNKWDLWVLPMDGDRKPKPFLQTPASECHGQFSPDGRWIAYASNESGDYQVYVQGFASGSAGKWQISTAGGAEPRWRRDGKELYYLSPAFQMMAVDVKSGSTFEAGPPRVLFQRRRPGVGLGNFSIDYTVTADGQRFLATTSVEETDTVPITVVVNWPAGLKR